MPKKRILHYAGNSVESHYAVNSVHKFFKVYFSPRHWKRVDIHSDYRIEIEIEDSVWRKHMEYIPSERAWLPKRIGRLVFADIASKSTVFVWRKSECDKHCRWEPETCLKLK